MELIGKQHLSPRNNEFLIISIRAVNNSILLTGLEFNWMVMDFLCPWHWFLIDFNVIRNCTQRSLYCLLTRSQRRQREQFRRKVEVNQTPREWSKIYIPQHFQPQLLPRHPFLFLFLFPFLLRYPILFPNPWRLLHNFRGESVTFTLMLNVNFEINVPISQLFPIANHKF